MLDYTEFIENFYNTKDIINSSPSQHQYNSIGEDSYSNNYISFNEKISKILNDPTILKLEEYIKDFKKTNKNDKENEEDKDDYELNFIDINDKVKDITIPKEENINEKENDKNEENSPIIHLKDNNSVENLKKRFLNKKKKMLEEKYKKSLGKVLDNKESINNENRKFMFPRFKENENDTVIKMENNNTINKNKNYTLHNSINNTLDKKIEEKIIAKRKELKEKIKKLFLNELKYCFNKGYYSKEFNIIGNGNFKNCYNLIEKLNKNNIREMNKISKIKNVVSKIKYNKEEVDLDEYLKESLDKTKSQSKKNKQIKK